MIASLPMYDTATTAPANDRFWRAIRTAYGRGPDDLDRKTDPHQTWQAKTLTFSQTCGLPYRRELHGQVHLVGTPDYGLADCPPGYYRSLLVTRADDPRTECADFAQTRLARNDIRSQSGWAALVTHFKEAGAADCIPFQIKDTGSHLASVRAVAEDEADIAAIDAVTWAFLCRDSNATGGLKVLAKTVPTPGLPYITSLGENADHLYAAVSRAISYIGAADRETLMIKGIVRIAEKNYLSVPMP